MKALVLSGGGEAGAYQVGVLQRWAEDGYEPDIICGVSVGAMSGGYLAQFPFGHFKDGVESLGKLWLKIRTQDIIRPWPLSYLQIPWESAVYDSTPHGELIDKWISPHEMRKSGRRFRAVCVEWRTKDVLVGTENDTEILQYIKASSSFPLFMLPVDVHGRSCTDGGARDVAPIKQAILAGATDLRIISCSNPDLLDIWEPAAGIRTFISYVLRFAGIVMTEIVANDYRVCGLKNDLAVTSSKYMPLSTTVVRPRRPLETELLEFTPEQAKRLIHCGYEDACLVL